MGESLTVSMQPHVDGWKPPGGPWGLVLWPLAKREKARDGGPG